MHFYTVMKFEPGQLVEIWRDIISPDVEDVSDTHIVDALQFF